MLRKSFIYCCSSALVRPQSKRFHASPIAHKIYKVTGVSEGSSVKFKSESNGEVTINAPLESVLSSLAACEAATARIFAPKKGLQLGKIEFTKVEGNMDVKFFMNGGGPTHFQSVEIEALVETPDSQEKLDELHKLIEERCPVYSMFAASGTKMNSVWKKK